MARGCVINYLLALYLVVVTTALEGRRLWLLLPLLEEEGCG